MALSERVKAYPPHLNRGEVEEITEDEKILRQLNLIPMLHYQDPDHPHRHLVVGLIRPHMLWRKHKNLNHLGGLVHGDLEEALGTSLDIPPQIRRYCPEDDSFK